MKVRRRVYPSGKIVWQADGGLREGRRLQAVFSTKRAAEEQLVAWASEGKEMGDAVAGLSRAEKMELGLWVWRCREAGLGIAEVMEAGLSAVQTRARPTITVRKAVEETMAERRRIGVSDRWQGTLAGILRSLCVWEVQGRAVGEMDLTALDAEVVLSWLEGNGWTPRTKNGYLGGVRTMTAWAVRAGMLAVCPLETIPRWMEVAAEVKRLTVPQCKVLLRTVARTDAELLGFVGLGLFGGVRPAEIRRLHWTDWRAETGEVVIAAAKAKTRQRDVIEVPGPGPEWIERGRAEAADVQGGRICPTNFVRRWARAREAAGLLAEWPEDGLRHTAATMHYALHRNEAAVQALLRHRSGAMLHRHYRGLATKGEAEGFWALTPREVLRSGG